MIRFQRRYSLCEFAQKIAMRYGYSFEELYAKLQFLFLETPDDKD